MKKKTFEEDMEKFGEDFEKKFDKFGKKIEKDFDNNKFNGVYYMNYGNKASIFGIIIGLFILAWGVIWFGNDLKWWAIDFPIWPAIIIAGGLMIILSELRKMIIK